MFHNALLCNARFSLLHRWLYACENWPCIDILQNDIDTLQNDIDILQNDIDTLQNVDKQIMPRWYLRNAHTLPRSLYSGSSYTVVSVSTRVCVRAWSCIPCWNVCGVSDGWRRLRKGWRESGGKVLLSGTSNKRYYCILSMIHPSPPLPHVSSHD